MPTRGGSSGQTQQGQLQAGGLSPGAAAGLSIGVLAIAGALAGAAWWVFRGDEFGRLAGRASSAQLKKARAAFAVQAGGSESEVVKSPLWRGAV